MNRTGFVGVVAHRIGGDKRAAEAAVDAVFSTIIDRVAHGEKVVITGFGMFERKMRPARDARNPTTGTTVHVPATAVPTFKPGATFRRQVADRRPE